MQAYQKLETIFERLAYLQHLSAIAGWDEAVMMPTGGSAVRAQALAVLRRVSHDMLSDPQLGAFIEKAKEEPLEDVWQQANLRWMEKLHLNESCLPADLVQHITQATIRCEQAWRVMRAENNWKDFAPLLEETVSLIKKSADIRSDVFQRSPYDVLLDDFTAGITKQDIDPIFATLKKTLPTLVEDITAKQKNQPIIEIAGHFPEPLQQQLGLELMRAIGFDFNHGRLDVSHHPFCGGDPEDVRMTTRYNTDEFITAAMAVCHETGHARFEQGLPKKWLRQPVGRIHSMVVHESQSLLIEMQACRSREFMNFLSPLIMRTFGDEEAYHADNLYHLYTTVKRSFIRVDADEVTYPLHVILRYELEKELMEGDMKVSDLPDAWDAAMIKYFGLSTKGNYKEGVMQDVHWPSGAFGYFPAYTLGSLTAAQLFAAARQAYPEIPQQLAQGNFTHLYNWLGKHVHSKASSVDYAALMRGATGEVLNPDYFLRHVKRRYLGRNAR